MDKKIFGKRLKKANKNLLKSILFEAGLRNRVYEILLAQKYGSSREGMLKAVEENGGMSTLNNALKYMDNPLVVTTLSKLGIDVNSLKTMAKSIQQTNGNTNSALNPSNYSNNVVDDLQKRLERLKQ